MKVKSRDEEVKEWEEKTKIYNELWEKIRDKYGVECINMVGELLDLERELTLVEECP